MLLCCLVYFYFPFNWGTHLVCGDPWHLRLVGVLHLVGVLRLVGVLHLGVVILFWLADWFGSDQWLSSDGICCPESLPCRNSLNRGEEDVQCPSLLSSVVLRYSIQTGRGSRDGEDGVECPLPAVLSVLQHPDRGPTDGEGGVVECFLLVGVTHMGSPAVDTARHS